MAMQRVVNSSTATVDPILAQKTAAPTAQQNTVSDNLFADTGAEQKYVYRAQTGQSQTLRPGQNYTAGQTQSQYNLQNSPEVTPEQIAAINDRRDTMMATNAQASPQPQVRPPAPTSSTNLTASQNTGIVPPAASKVEPYSPVARGITTQGPTDGFASAAGQSSGRPVRDTVGTGNPPGSTTGTGTGNGNSTSAQIVPGNPGKDPNAINVVDWAGQIATDPSMAFRQDDPNTPQNESQMLSDRLSTPEQIAAMTQEGLINGNDPKYQMDFDALNVKSKDVKGVKAQDANSYNVDTAAGKVAQNEMQGAEGSLSQGAQVQAAQIDNEATYNQQNAVGKALANYAAQDMSNIIDTGTAAGKLLADQLGQGNYLDSKATLKGQLDILQNEFVDQNTGEPKIPSWAASTARNVSKIAAFKGMTGTAATAAMSQALLEASIPIAQADSQFFQTLTMQNLSNKQQSVINTANTLAKFEQTNVDNRMAAAIQNSKSFLEMDMKNLDNEQQERVINNQARVQSILEDSKQENAKRLFVADSQNDMDKFYDQLNTQINQYNSSQNLDAQKFNSTLADSREKFYKEMQFNIDVSNAKWRQTVQLQEDQQAHEANTTDVKNMFDMQTNQLNQLWDRSDATLDYIWKGSESEKDRKQRLMEAAILADAQADAAMWEGLGTVTGALVGSAFGSKALGSLFGI